MGGKCPKEKKLKWQRDRRDRYIRDGLCPEPPHQPLAEGHKQCYSCLRKKKEESFTKRFLLKLETLDIYGSVCTCCGETRPEFLTIEHLNNDGKIHKKLKLGSGVVFYSWLKKNGFPQNLNLTVRCFNCNCARSSYGICPHEEERHLAKSRKTA